MKSLRFLLLLGGTLLLGAVCPRLAWEPTLLSWAQVGGAIQEPVEIAPAPPRGRERFPGEPPRPGAVLRRKPVDVAAAKKEANQLADLAGKIPGQVDQLSKNVAPKDLLLQLKQIEKLAKHLRKQIEP